MTKNKIVENLNKAAGIAKKCKTRKPTEEEATEFIRLTGLQRHEVEQHMAIMNGKGHGCTKH
jgi:hypothetical protein